MCAQVSCVTSVNEPSMSFLMHLSSCVTNIGTAAINSSDNMYSGIKFTRRYLLALFDKKLTQSAAVDGSICVKEDTYCLSLSTLRPFDGRDKSISSLINHV